MRQTNWLTFLKDRVRVENEKTAARLHFMIEQSYGMLGYFPVKVPVLPVKKRAEFILQHL
jgi:predicted ATPase